MLALENIDTFDNVFNMLKLKTNQSIYFNNI